MCTIFFLFKQLSLSSNFWQINGNNFFFPFYFGNAIATNPLPQFFFPSISAMPLPQTNSNNFFFSFLFQLCHCHKSIAIIFFFLFSFYFGKAIVINQLQQTISAMPLPQTNCNKFFFPSISTMPLP